MARLTEHARSGLRAAALGVWTVGAIHTSLLHLRMRPEHAQDALRDRWVRGWAAGLLRIFGIEEHLVAPPPPLATGPRLVVCAHRSPLDILLMLHHCGGAVLSRADLAQWPVLGRAARQGGTIFVEREDARSGARAIRAIRRELKNGRTVTVFPEGTTVRGDAVRPFQLGAFAAARGLDVEIVPVGVAYEPGAEFVDESFGRYVARMAGRPRIRVGTCFGPPRAARGKSDALARELRDEVEALVGRAREALGTPS